MIDEYYTDRTLLITGGTGFLGQGLIAKALRDLPQIRKIYVLIRPRRRPDGQLVQAEERLSEELLTASVFDRFRAEDAQGFASARGKLEAVAGDVTLPELGIADGDVKERLLAEVDTIFGSAATVVFDEPLDQSIALNARGPLSLLELARSCHKQVDFVHVSTAYVNGQLTGNIPEETLPTDRSICDIIGGKNGAGPVFDPHEELEACDRVCASVYEEAGSDQQLASFRRDVLRQNRSHELSEERVEQLIQGRRDRWTERRLIDEGMKRAKQYGWNDVYTFTKGMGEQLLVAKRENQRLVIVRPSIIESSLSDPEPGWITGMKVMDPLVAAYGRGLLPDFPAGRDLVLDLIPVDIVVNATLAAATQASSSGVPVFQVATGEENPVLLSTVFDQVRAYFLNNPMRDREGKSPKLTEWSYPSLRRFRLMIRLRYLIPLRAREWFLDRMPSSMTSATQRRLTATLKMRIRRVLYYSEIYHPYTHLRCVFETRRLRDLFGKLTPAEQSRFSTDVARIDWKTYMQEIHVPGLRRHVLKDDISNGLASADEVSGDSLYPDSEELES